MERMTSYGPITIDFIEAPEWEQVPLSVRNNVNEVIFIPYSPIQITFGFKVNQITASELSKLPNPYCTLKCDELVNKYPESYIIGKIDATNIWASNSLIQSSYHMFYYKNIVNLFPNVKHHSYKTYDISPFTSLFITGNVTGTLNLNIIFLTRGPIGIDLDNKTIISESMNPFSKESSDDFFLKLVRELTGKSDLIFGNPLSQEELKTLELIKELRARGIPI